MTTIAWDGKHVAWDSRITQGGEIVDYPADKVWTLDKKIYCFAGDFALLDDVISWHAKGARAKFAKDNFVGSWELLVIDKKGAFVYSCDVPHRSRVQAPFAMGSGSYFARGALLAGAPAYKAVQIACKCDVFSGGEINSLDAETVF
jgi:ATP-dependent protease HslVU (ClpYQ) peptidase subunit